MYRTENSPISGTTRELVVTGAIGSLNANERDKTSAQPATGKTRLSTLNQRRQWRRRRIKRFG